MKENKNYKKRIRTTPGTTSEKISEIRRTKADKSSINNPGRPSFDNQRGSFQRIDNYVENALRDYGSPTNVSNIQDGSGHETPVREPREWNIPETLEPRQTSWNYSSNNPHSTVKPSSERRSVNQLSIERYKNKGETPAQNYPESTPGTTLEINRYSDPASTLDRSSASEANVFPDYSRSDPTWDVPARGSFDDPFLNPPQTDPTTDYSRVDSSMDASSVTEPIPEPTYKPSETEPHQKPVRNNDSYNHSEINSEPYPETSGSSSDYYRYIYSDVPMNGRGSYEIPSQTLSDANNRSFGSYSRDEYMTRNYSDNTQEPIQERKPVEVPTRQSMTIDDKKNINDVSLKYHLRGHENSGSVSIRRPVPENTKNNSEPDVYESQGSVYEAPIRSVNNINNNPTSSGASYEIPSQTLYDANKGSIPTINPEDPRSVFTQPVSGGFSEGSRDNSTDVSRTDLRDGSSKGYEHDLGYGSGGVVGGGYSSPITNNQTVNGSRTSDTWNRNESIRDMSMTRRNTEITSETTPEPTRRVEVPKRPNMNTNSGGVSGGTSGDVSAMRREKIKNYDSQNNKNPNDTFYRNTDRSRSNDYDQRQTSFREPVTEQVSGVNVSVTRDYERAWARYDKAWDRYDNLQDMTTDRERSGVVSEGGSKERKPVEVPKRPSETVAETNVDDIASLRRANVGDVSGKTPINRASNGKNTGKNISRINKEETSERKSVNEVDRSHVTETPVVSTGASRSGQIGKSVPLDAREKINKEIRGDFDVNNDIAVSNTTRDIAEQRAEDGKGTRGSNPYTVANVPGRQKDLLDMAIKRNENIGTAASLISGGVKRPATATDKANAMVDLLYDDGYVNTLRNNAKTTIKQIEKLERKRKQLNQSVEYATMTEKQLNEYSFQSDNLDREINSLKTRYNNLELKYMRQTGRDFKGNASHNVVDVSMRQVKLDKNRVEELKSQVQSLEEIAVKTEKAEFNKNIIIQRKKQEIERAERKLKESEEKALEIQTWESSSDGQKMIKKWEKREERLKKQDAKRKSGIRAAVNTGIDRVEDVMFSPARKVQHGVNNLIDKGLYVAKTPFRMAGDFANSVASKAYLSLMKTKTFKAANNAFSSVGSALRIASGNAKSAIFRASSKASDFVKKIMMTLFKFFFTNPVGIGITAMFVICMILARMYTPDTSELAGNVNESSIIDIANFNNQSVYSRYVYEVREKTIDFRKKYRVFVTPADVATLLISSMDQKLLTEFVTEKTYVDVIKALLQGDKAEIAAKAFLKQVDYNYYYLKRDWEPWLDIGIASEEYDTATDAGEYWVMDESSIIQGDDVEELRKNYDEVAKERKEVTVYKAVERPGACDAQFLVPEAPDMNDFYDYEYINEIYDENGNHIDTKYGPLVLDTAAYNLAVEEYNEAVEKNNQCHTDIKYAYDNGCTDTKPFLEEHDVWRTRNFKDQKWVLITDKEAFEAGYIPEDAEIMRESLTVKIGETEDHSHNEDAPLVISENDMNDRPAPDKESEDIWVWINGDDPAHDHDLCKWLAEDKGSTQYYLKKKKFWDTWSFEQLSSLLTINYNILMHDDAPASPGVVDPFKIYEEFDNFHQSEENPHVIEIWDTEDVYQGVNIDLDEFYKKTSHNQFSIYEYDPVSMDAIGVIKKLGYFRERMIFYVGYDSYDDIPPEDKLTSEELVKMRNIEKLSREEQNELVPELALIDDEGIRKMLTYAVSLIGTPYIHSHDLYASGGLDCSGFAYWIVNNCGNGWYMPFTTTYGYVNNCNSGYVTEVSRDDLKPGDFIVIDWNNCGDYSHMGVYMGDGRIIHTGGNPDGVSYQELNNPAYTHWYNSPKKYYRLTERVRGGN